MPDASALRLDPARGERLARPVYKRDFRGWHTALRNRRSWKFERRQHFEEVDPSREALRRGDWSEALRLLEDERDELRASVAERRDRSYVFRRVRVVEEPLTPYLQWELHALRVQAECGMPVRVVMADKVCALEHTGMLPEVVVLGGEVLYEVRYTDEGVSADAVRYTDRGLIGAWETFIESLYAQGEDVVSYVDRYVDLLPPPRLAAEGRTPNAVNPENADA